MTEPLIWVHGDCLDPHSPARRTYPTAPAVFVFDDELLAQYNLSFKRLLFLYECLLEIPNLQIRKGNVVEELAQAALEHDTTRLVTVYTVAPRFQELLNRLRREKKLGVEVLDVAPFIEMDEEEEASLDLRRFSRYWQVMRDRALKGGS